MRGPNCIQRWDSRHYPLTLHSERGGGQRGAERSRCSWSAVKSRNRCNELTAVTILSQSKPCTPAHLKQHQPFGYGPMTQEHLWRTSVRFMHLCTILWPSFAHFKGSLQIFWGPEAAVQSEVHTPTSCSCWGRLSPKGHLKQKSVLIKFIQIKDKRRVESCRRLWYSYFGAKLQQQLPYGTLNWKDPAVTEKTAKT